ncbi:MAG: ABC transporter permease, partial [Flammeovirgaceae bacterium]
MLIIGTVVVFRQIEFAKDRPAGYDRFNIVQFITTTSDLHNHFDAFRAELKATGVVQEISESGSPPTNVWNTNGGFTWKGKDPALAVDFPNNAVTHEYGKVMGWQFKEGRDFSRDHATDSLTFVINESMQKFLGFEHPVGEVLTWNDKAYTIIGVINDMIIESPYEPVRPSLFHISRDQENVFCLKLNPNTNPHEALATVETIFKKYNPSAPFDYRFVDQDYARKFGDEVRVGKLASFFATLAILISCLGIFGLASFVAEQRTKEIGVRKVMGASVFNLWRMLSKDFVVLVLISLAFAIPLSFYGMNMWLQKYEYRSTHHLAHSNFFG